MLSRADDNVTTESGTDTDDDIIEVVAPAPSHSPSSPPRDHVDWDGGKVEWTDDDSDSSGAKSNPKAPGKRGRKRRRTANLPDEDGETRTHTKRKDRNIVPDVVRERRREFDEARRILGNAGLRLPPKGLDGVDYGTGTDSKARRAEKPQFGARSGVIPCRLYEPIELRDSAGWIPSPTAQYLRDYQTAGVRFLHRLFVFQRGGILGDDMGLGKTVQVAAFLTAAYGKTGDERDAGRMRQARRDPQRWYPITLIICPGSLIQNWRNELDRWGWWVVDVFHGSTKDAVLQMARAGRLEIMITTYDTYKLNAEAVNMVQWDCVVADEFHRAKDRASETTRALDRINALCRIGLTGTAIQNRYEELWTLLNWTNPGRFGTAAEWNRTISQPLRVGQSHDATLSQLSLARLTAKKLVHNLLPEFFLRRMKSLIAEQLPRKTDRVVFCPLTTLQREAYENFLSSADVTTIRTVGERCDCESGRKKGWCCYQKLSDGRPWLTVVFPAMVVLQKLSNHVVLLAPSTVADKERQATDLRNLRTCFPNSWEQIYQDRDRISSLSNAELCGKWKILRKLLRFWHDNGDKVLVFSHSVRLLRVLQHLFSTTSHSVSFLDGSLSYEERQRVVDDFNSNPHQFVFLISTKAGGVGLNITSANKVVIMDPHWNPSYDLQAQDRAYRIGQTRDVDVFRLVSVGTIEEIVYARQIYKQQQANIGYTASSERRYFKGVQEDHSRTGEIFGLDNLFSFHGDRPVLRDIVNKTNIAEARVGVGMVDLEVEKVDDDVAVKRDVHEEDGIRQLAVLVAQENQALALEASHAKESHSDAIQAILTAAGVEYTHENSEVVGTSRVEAQLSRRAELAGGVVEAPATKKRRIELKDDAAGNESALFLGSSQPGPDGDSDVEQGGYDMHSAGPFWYRFNPSKEVRERQFCSMAREFGFGADVTGFALAVESWTQEQRRDCLDTFYRRRAAMLGRELEGREGREDAINQPGGGEKMMAKHDDQDGEDGDDDDDDTNDTNDNKEDKDYEDEDEGEDDDLDLDIVSVKKDKDESRTGITKDNSIKKGRQDGNVEIKATTDEVVVVRKPDSTGGHVTIFISDGDDDDDTDEL